MADRSRTGHELNEMQGGQPASYHLRSLVYFVSRKYFKLFREWAAPLASV